MWPWTRGSALQFPHPTTELSSSGGSLGRLEVTSFRMESRSSTTANVKVWTSDARPGQNSSTDMLALFGRSATAQKPAYYSVADMMRRSKVGRCMAKGARRHFAVMMAG
mmetsp:Transcript_15718/g.34356  ORF Transcript_15718/g.34356 Transcript_15718/m.34356 type:complete len:109 (-) Transcript_15718:1024-1350(-)